MRPQRSDANTSSSRGPPGDRPRSRNHSRPRARPSTGPGRRSSSVSVRTGRPPRWPGRRAPRGQRAWRRGGPGRRPGGSAPPGRRTTRRSDPVGRVARAPGSHAHHRGHPPQQPRSTVASSTTGVPASSAREHADPVHLDVVGVAVATLRVVDRQHVGVSPPAGSRPAAGPGRPGRGPAKARLGGAVSAVGWPQPGVLVAQELPPRAAQGSGRRGELGATAVVETGGRTRYHRRTDQHRQRSRSRGRPGAPLPPRAPACRRSGAPRRPGARERRRG